MYSFVFRAEWWFRPLLLSCNPVHLSFVISSLPAIFHSDLSLLSLLGFLSSFLFLIFHILLLQFGRSSGPPGLLWAWWLWLHLVIRCMLSGRPFFCVFFLSFAYFVFSSVGLLGLTVLFFCFPYCGFQGGDYSVLYFPIVIPYFNIFNWRIYFLIVFFQAFAIV